MQTIQDGGCSVRAAIVHNHDFIVAQWRQRRIHFVQQTFDILLFIVDWDYNRDTHGTILALLSTIPIVRGNYGTAKILSM